MSRGTVFFDYDGTLHETMNIYGPAVRKAYQWLVDQGAAPACTFTDERISRWLGLTGKVMWNDCVPGISEPHWRGASEIPAAVESLVGAASGSQTSSNQ